MFFRTQALVVAVSLGLVFSAVAQLEPALQAHGGLAKWQSYGGVEFDLKWTSARGTKQDHQLFDLHTRDGLITSAKYSLGAHQGNVWVQPNAAALGGTPPRFYLWTPFYFFGMPFVFADPGAILEPLGKKSFQGAEYNAVKISFRKGTGDTPDDFYVAYFDAQSGQLKLASYIVTYPALRKGKPVEELEQHAIVFHEWQEVDGLRVPKLAPFYLWKDETIEGEPLGTLEFSQVHFLREAPAAAKFAPPEGAVALPLE